MTTSPGWADSEAVIQALAALRRYSDARAQGKRVEALACLAFAVNKIDEAGAALAEELERQPIIQQPQPLRGPA